MSGPTEPTPRPELERQIMSWTEPKSEREWWARNAIEKLRERIAELEAQLGNFAERD